MIFFLAIVVPIFQTARRLCAAAMRYIKDIVTGYSLLRLMLMQQFFI